MKIITTAAVTVAQRSRLLAIGAKYVIPAQAGQPAGWQVNVENEAQARMIIEEKPKTPVSIVILSVANIGYDPGVTYYSATYRIDGGPEHTATLASLQAAAEGQMARGMDIAPDAVRLYHAAQAAAEADYYRPMGNWGPREKRVIA